jgi:hypothetical protein
MQPVAASAVWSKHFQASQMREMEAKTSKLSCPENMILTHEKGVCHLNGPNSPDYRMFFYHQISTTGSSR